MKFLCVPCDSQMALQSVAPPAGGSLSVVYACPECGYEMAMLTNAFETQIVQSLGVRIGPQADAAANGTSASKCPFSAMVPSTDSTERGPGGDGRRDRTVEPEPVRWTPAAEARLAKVPEFVRPMARTGIEKFARDQGSLEVDETMLDAARDYFGM